MLNKDQQNQITDGLLQLGLTERESTVYLAVLHIGMASIIDIAKETGLSRGTSFDIVERLVEKGYFVQVKNGKKRRISVDNPTGAFYKRLDILHDRFSKTKKIVEEALPLIKSIDSRSDFKPQIRIYAGEQGFKKVWEEILDFEDKSFLSIARIETFIKFAGEDYLFQLQKRKSDLGFSSRAINENSVFAQRLVEVDDFANRETRLAPKEFEFPSTEIIYGDKIAMFSTKEENIIVVIESKDFAQTHRAYFEMMWKLLQKSN